MTNTFFQDDVAYLYRLLSEWRIGERCTPRPETSTSKSFGALRGVPGRVVGKTGFSLVVCLTEPEDRRRYARYLQEPAWFSGWLTPDTLAALPSEACLYRMNPRWAIAIDDDDNVMIG